MEKGASDGMWLADAHCHLSAAGDLAGQATAQWHCGLSLVNSAEPGDWATVIASADRAGKAAAIGIHPWAIAQADAARIAELERHLAATAALQVGEIGLDGQRGGPLARQIAVLEAQVALAERMGRAVSLHLVGSWGAFDTYLRQRGGIGTRWLVHGYGGSAQMAARYCGSGAWLSFGAGLLDARRGKLRAALRAVPTERILLESDSAPGALESERVARLRAVYVAAAEVLGVTVAALQAQVGANLQAYLGAVAGS